jgi:hypothetical protein
MMASTQPTSTSPYTLCDYIARRGLCGKRCFGGRCNIHRGRQSLTFCKQGCGRATASKTGFCPCTSKQADHGHRLKKKRDQMDAYIDEILSWNWKPE